MSSFVVLGVLARVDSKARDAVEQHLSARPGVSVFAVDDPNQIGILIEDETLMAAEDTLKDWISTAPGILGAWPVFLHDEPDDREFDPSSEQDLPAARCANEG